MAPVTADAYFAAVFLVLKIKLRILASHLLKAAKRVFGIPDFRLYALADGIHHYLYNQTKGLRKLLEAEKPVSIQRSFFDL